uniref:Transmembrane protein n=1 Tax=Rhizophora mucronata TaxID=61149 RepID=A0A2P2IV70_RHIMU
MASEQTGDQQAPSPPSGFSEMVLERYRKIKEHAETYPSVWASYIAVYGGFGLWFIYRWTKLRRTEDRVRAIHQSLREKRERANSASSDQSTLPPPTSVEEIPPPAAPSEKAPSSNKAPK